jgi:hypothetical protein
MSFGPRYSESDARAAVAGSHSWAESLRRLGMCPTGGATGILRKYAEVWGISTAHFRSDTPRPAAALSTYLVRGSTYSRFHLKRRLLAEGLVENRCALCGQEPEWQGRQMALVLDHINGVRDDNRLENLRIVCPNCNATLDTHCGRNRRKRPDRPCELCGTPYSPRYDTQRFCSRRCGVRHNLPRARRVDRPPYEQLMREIEATSYLAVGRRYGVSDNAIRKWVLAYRREAASGGDDGLASAA